MKNITNENYDKEDVYGYISTFTGGKVTFMNPQPEQFNIFDITVGLSHNCRYAGQCAMFYSVAEHSVIMANYFIGREEYEKAYTALMHDATEAYLVDIPRPIKPHLKGYLEIESKLQEVIFEAFKVPPMCNDVKHLDCHIVRDEAKYVFNETPSWVDDYESYGLVVAGLEPEEARRQFISCFLFLTKKLGLEISQDTGKVVE